MVDAVFVIGPTACGKSDLAIKISQVLPIEIISVDSANVYRQLNIGTAKPTKNDLTIVRHHLIDICEPFEPYNVANFVSDATSKIKEIQARKHLPLIVGGTMLYVNAMVNGLSEIPSSDNTIREKVSNDGKAKGWPAMHQVLEKIDPETAKRLSQNDSQRISRALEIYYQTGKTLSSFYSGNSISPRYSYALVGLMPSDRKKLHEKIRIRFDQMLQQGFINEVKELMKKTNFNRHSPSMRCVGYRQAISYLNGEDTKEEFIEKALAATRQLAKRQMTWMRSMDNLFMVDPFDDNFYEQVISYIKTLEFNFLK